MCCMNGLIRSYHRVFIEPERAIGAADFMVELILHWIGRGFALVLFCFVCRALSTFRFRQLSPYLRSL